MRKKILRTFIAMLVISSFLVVPAYAEGATVTGNRVNFRAGPGMNYYVIATLDKGTAVTVTDRSNSSWYAVSVGGMDGFISSSYLSLDSAGTSATVSSYTPPVTVTESSDGYINAMYVRFRSGPGSGYSVLGTYNSGKALSVVGTDGAWTACVIDGQYGYVYSQYVSTGSSSGTSSAGGVTIVTAATVTPAASYALPQPNESSGTTIILPDPTSAPAATASPAPAVTASPAPAVTAVPAAAASSSSGSGALGYINGTYVRFRTGAGTNYSIIGTYNTGKELYVTGAATDGWYPCVIDGTAGYVYAKYVLVADQAAFNSITGSYSDSLTVDGQPAAATPTPTPTPTAAQYTDAYITGNNVRFRSAPSMTSSILAELFYGNKVSLITAHDGWAQIVYNNTVGYVYSQYVKEGSYDTVTVSGSTGSAAESVTTGSATGSDIANYALQFVGYNYCWGGASPSTGFDCSGLVYYTYKQFGYTLNRVAADQAKNGRHVDSSELQPGDILCFYSGSSYIGHVGIYIGNGQFVHASNSTTGVIISDLSGRYVTRGYEARRIIG